MADELQALKDNLAVSASARARFTAGVLDLLKNNGINVDDPAVIEHLGLSLNLADAKSWMNTVASTNIITITH